MSEAPRPERALELGAILLDTTHLTEEQLDEARVAQAADGGRLADHLLSSGRVSADQVLEALSRQLGLPVLPSIDIGNIDEDLIERVPIGFAKAHGIVPIQRTSDGAIRVAVTDPWPPRPSMTFACSSRAPKSGWNSPINARSWVRSTRSTTAALRRPMRSPRMPPRTWTRWRARSVRNPRTCSKPPTIHRSSSW